MMQAHRSDGVGFAASMLVVALGGPEWLLTQTVFEQTCKYH